MKLNRNLKVGFLGIISGFLNGLFGAGGGVAVVPLLQNLNIEPVKAHATSIAIILPLSIFSMISYLINGVKINGYELLFLIPFGLIGAFIGSKILSKINNSLIQKIFSVIIIISGFRMIIG